ncbi:hypothetical protein LPJ53_000933 [Coemansia erecta]|uniref:Ras-domain-containing protein n=1 Tax=Coemansia erecta TaxID=147472 RepID=A0A9W7Y536_9FUNG|nr:hypothetical protein LPJ53_000933 [Coemansia erecta]
MSRLLIPEYKVVMLGSGGVGKSMLTTRFINGNFSEDYDPTIEDSYRKQCEVDDMTCVLDVLDTAGQEEYIALRDYHIRSGNCFVIVYSILSKATLNEAEAIANKIFQTKNTYDVPIVLVGNKCDCATSRKVTPEEGREVAKRIKSGFYESSAKEGIKVDDIFIQCVRRTKHFNKQIDQSGAQAAASAASAQHSREPSTQTEKTTGFEKLKSSTKSWLPGRKSLSREKASAVNTPNTTPPPQVTVLPLKRYDTNIPDYYLESFSSVTDRPATGSTSKRSNTETSYSSSNNEQATKGHTRDHSGSSSSSSTVGRRHNDTRSTPPPKRAHNYSNSEPFAKHGAGTRSSPPPPRQIMYTNLDKSLPQHSDMSDPEVPSLKRSLGTDTESQPTRRRIDKDSIRVVSYDQKAKMNTNKALPRPKRRGAFPCPIL